MFFSEAITNTFGVASLLAEFRGPGVHHNFDDSDSGYDVEEHNKQGGGKSFGIGGYRGRIIFLGDGTEVLTDSDDTEMFDNAEEDKDLASQVAKSSSSGDEEASAAAAAAASTEKSETPSEKPSAKTEEKPAAKAEGEKGETKKDS